MPSVISLWLPVCFPTCIWFSHSLAGNGTYLKGRNLIIWVREICWMLSSRMRLPTAGCWETSLALKAPFNSVLWFSTSIRILRDSASILHSSPSLSFANRLLSVCKGIREQKIGEWKVNNDIFCLQEIHNLVSLHLLLLGDVSVLVLFSFWFSSSWVSFGWIFAMLSHLLSIYSLLRWFNSTCLVYLISPLILTFLTLPCLDLYFPLLCIFPWIRPRNHYRLWGLKEERREEPIK